MKDRLVVGVVGLPGSGKTTFARTAEELGFQVVIMGDVIRGEAKRRGLEPTSENLGRLMMELRRAEGEAVVAKRCIPQIEKAEGPVVVDGIRSLAEVDEFRKHYPNFKLVAVFSSPETRFHRLYKRGRSDAPQDWNTFVERDLRELSVGVGSAMALADHMLVNEGTLEDFRRETKRLLRELMKNERS
ncbi:MAG TPA: flagellar hook-basal body complex protein FliE [Candidatus Bathyarchaeota archaeon]|nr:flagellar hook-basal body complex protein FliE [Candidatus Bathyarchaeota archaeon]